MNCEKIKSLPAKSRRRFSCKICSVEVSNQHQAQRQLNWINGGGRGGRCRIQVRSRMVFARYIFVPIEIKYLLKWSFSKVFSRKVGFWGFALRKIFEERPLERWRTAFCRVFLDSIQVDSTMIKKYRVEHFNIQPL